MSTVVSCLLGMVDGSCRVDEADVTERLWIVSKRFPGGGRDFFGEEADVVGAGEGSFADCACARHFADQGQGVGEPEGAQQERPLVGCEIVPEIAT